MPCHGFTCCARPCQNRVVSESRRVMIVSCQAVSRFVFLKNIPWDFWQSSISGRSQGMFFLKKIASGILSPSWLPGVLKDFFLEEWPPRFLVPDLATTFVTCSKCSVSWCVKTTSFEANGWPCMWNSYIRIHNAELKQASFWKDMEHMLVPIDEPGEKKNGRARKSLKHRYDECQYEDAEPVLLWTSVYMCEWVCVWKRLWVDTEHEPEYAHDTAYNCAYDYAEQ